MKENSDYFVKGDFIYNERIKQTFFKNSMTRLFVYQLQSLLYKTIIFINKCLSEKLKVFKYTVSICAIFKNEAKFLDEWIKFHLVIGIDHFYLYNNNSDDNYLEILKPYIDKGIVELIDWPQNHAQMKVYEDCYFKYKNETNWIAFIDIDEFLCPLSSSNIKIWLSSYKHLPCVAVYWKQFGTNGKLYHDNNRLVIEQYTQCWPKYSSFTKMICNMNFSFKKFQNPHRINSELFGIVLPPVDQFKKLICFGINRSFFNKKASIQINHYWCKAYDSFVESKINRSDVYHVNDNEMSNVRKRLLKSYESLCTEREYNIQKFLLFTKMQKE